MPTKKSLERKAIAAGPALRAENISHEYRRTKSTGSILSLRGKILSFCHPSLKTQARKAVTRVTESENYSVTIPSPVTLWQFNPLDRLEVCSMAGAESGEKYIFRRCWKFDDRILPGDRIDDAI